MSRCSRCLVYVFFVAVLVPDAFLSFFVGDMLGDMFGRCFGDVGEVFAILLHMLGTCF